MAYNRKNLLRRAQDIHNIVDEHAKHGASQEWIYKNKIYPIYKISRSRFYDYMKLWPEDELRRIEEAEKLQTKLF